jgi:hypothetical protein
MCPAAFLCIMRLVAWQPDPLRSKLNGLLGTLEGTNASLRTRQRMTPQQLHQLLAAQLGPGSSVCRLMRPSFGRSRPERACQRWTWQKKSVRDKFVIVSDSLACLQRVQNRQFDKPPILERAVKVHLLISAGCDIVSNSCRQVTLVWLINAAADDALVLQTTKGDVKNSNLKPVTVSFYGETPEL